MDHQFAPSGWHDSRESRVESSFLETERNAFKRRCEMQKRAINRFADITSRHQCYVRPSSATMRRSPRRRNPSPYRRHRTRSRSRSRSRSKHRPSSSPSLHKSSSNATNSKVHDLDYDYQQKCEEVKKLRKSLDSANASLENANKPCEMCSKLQIENDELKLKMEAKDRKLENLKNDFSVKEKQMVALLLDVRQRYKSALSLIRNQMTNLKAEILNLVSVFDDNMKGAVKAFPSLNKQIQSMENSIALQTNKFEEYQRKLNAVSKYVDQNNQDNIGEGKESSKAASSRNSCDIAEHNLLKQRLETANGNNKKLNEELSKTLEREKSWTSKCNEVQSKLTETENSLDKARKESTTIDELKSKLMEVEAVSEEALEKSQADLHRTIEVKDTYFKDFENAKNENSRLEQQLNYLNARYQSLQNDFEENKREKDSFYGDVSLSKDENIRLLDQELNDLKVKYQSLQSDNNRLKRRNGEIKALIEWQKIHDKDTERAGLVDQLAALQQKLANKRQSDRIGCLGEVLAKKGLFTKRPADCNSSRLAPSTTP